MDERDVLRAWREIFRDRETTHENLAKAEAFLDSLSGESPLHLRLANELADLKKLSAAPKKSRAARG
jgi:hypothetical protein